MFYMAFFEWAALIIGTLGTILWSFGKSQLTVSILWILSSMLWIVFAWVNGHYGLTARDTLSVIPYAIGVRTYWRSVKNEAVLSELDQAQQKCNINRQEYQDKVI